MLLSKARSLRTKMYANNAAIRFELLESRRLLAVSSVFNNGVFTVSSDAADSISISVEAGDVKINGSDPGSGPLSASLIEDLVVVGGPGANVISLSGVKPSDFTSLTSVEVNGNGGNDIIFDSDFSDKIFGGDDDDVFLISRTGNDTVYGGGGDDDIGIYSSGNITVFGEDGDDEISSGPGNDTLDGGSGADTYYFLIGSLGSDSLIEDTGNDDVDTLDFSDQANGVEISLNKTSSQSIGAAGSLTLSNASAFENAIGTNDDDTLYGNGRDNHIVGGGGNDTLVDLVGGSDLLEGGNDDDYLATIFGSSSILRGGEGNDQIGTGSGDDRLEGGNGDDTYLFGQLFGIGYDEIVEESNGGIDTLDFSGITGPITLDLTIDDLDKLDESDPQAGGVLDVSQMIGTAGTVTLVGSNTFENVIGTDGDDFITGNDQDNAIDGGMGNDFLIGGLGNDTLDGGVGDDYLQGDAGNDLLNGSNGKDVLEGGEGADVLNGGDQSDLLIANQLRITSHSARVAIWNVWRNTSDPAGDFDDLLNDFLVDPLAPVLLAGDDGVADQLDGGGPEVDALLLDVLDNDIDGDVNDEIEVVTSPARLLQSNNARLALGASVFGFPPLGGFSNAFIDVRPDPIDTGSMTGGSPVGVIETTPPGHSIVSSNQTGTATFDGTSLLNSVTNSVGGRGEYTVSNVNRGAQFNIGNGFGVNRDASGFYQFVGDPGTVQAIALFELNANLNNPGNYNSLPVITLRAEGASVQLEHTGSGWQTTYTPDGGTPIVVNATIGAVALPFQVAANTPFVVDANLFTAATSTVTTTESFIGFGAVTVFAT